jgi:hypothetical protein
MVEERRGVIRVVRDAHRWRGMGAADPTTLVIPDQLVPAGQGLLRQERDEPVGENRTDEQHRLA